MIHLGHLWSALEQPQADGPARSPGWVLHAYEAFTAKLVDQERTYPCYFGVQGQQRGNNWFAVFDSSSPREQGVRALGEALVEFREQAWRGPKRQTLIVFAGPPEPHARLSDHQTAFWRLLKDLSAVDPVPWPEGFTTDTADPAWQWCFAGEPWFTFMASPGYQHRDSRNLGPCLTLVFQTRRVFEGLSGSSVAGQVAKRRIRADLEHYDTVPPHPYLGDPAYSSVHKWRQYALPDDQSVGSPEKCPFTG
ncbi:YqcI/YcgG family protein [Streptomyces sp. SID9124]|nr:YqcI/YcgG family protein [Streptomyces sp. SID9124]